MTRWQQVKDLFLEAVELPQTDRNNWLRIACGTDVELRREVESLLASDQDAGTFCETPAAALLGAGTFDAPPPRLAPGLRLGRYEIAALIGTGGMGEVYRATDTRDGRQVALKTVGASLAHPMGTLRLMREARHASTLTHPNICAIREVGEVDGVPFIAMELVEGQTLGDVERDGPVPLDIALRYAIDIAGALEHAHQRGVVHRDLKSTNVMIDGSGRAIVLDFGLAKRLPTHESSQSMESLTASQQGPAGTLSHMAPEVLLGVRADERTDIWALGILLYRITAGDLPFKGRTPFETSSAILGDQPKPLARTVPLALRLVIERCLAKKPEDRYQRAADVHTALVSVHEKRAWPLLGPLLVGSRRLRIRALTAAVIVLVAIGLGMWLRQQRPSQPIRTVAILPLAQDGTDDAYAPGMTESLIAQLGAASNVRVISRASMRDVGDAKSAAENARAVASDAIVRGTLRRTGDRIGLDLQLVDAGSGGVLWSRSFSREAREVLALQADAVRAVADRLDAGLRPGARKRLALVPSVDPELYEVYLKGRYEWNQRTAGSLERAVALFQRAIALDPAYAPAHAALADCYNLLGTVMVGSGSPLEYRPLAEAAAIRALQIDPDSAEAHAALGYVRHYSWQWAEAEKEFLRAIELNPSQTLPRVWYANLLMSKGRFDEALQQAHAARQNDPFSLIVNTNIGWILYYAERNDEAVEQLTRTVALDPSYPQARWRLASALSAIGRHAEAVREADELLRLTKRSSSSLAHYAHGLARAGRVADARRVLDELTVRARREYVSPGTIPAAYTELGDHETALKWIGRAYAERANAVAYYAVDPWTKPLRAHPRFQTLLKDVGLATAPPQ